MEGSGEMKASVYKDAAPNGARRGATLARFVPMHNITRSEPMPLAAEPVVLAQSAGRAASAAGCHCAVILVLLQYLWWINERKPFVFPYLTMNVFEHGARPVTIDRRPSMARA